MAQIFQRQPRQGTLILADVEKARALGDPVRAAILQILSTREASIAEIKADLEKHGMSMAPTTVRHHMDLLKKAGLIELTRLEEARGGVLKYYASKVRLMEHSAPEGFEEKLESALEEAVAEALKFMKRLAKRHKHEIRQVAKSLKPCPHCNEEHFVEYVLIETMNRAMARAMSRKEFRGLLRELK